MSEMVNYETLLLAIPEITNEESSKFESQFTKLIKEAKGNIISFDRWGKYKLAYPVKKNEYGVYFLTRFEVPNESKDALFNQLKDMFRLKYSEIIMRHLISVLPAGKTLEYNKPRSLEENPQDIDTFLQKNKMKGILGSEDKLSANLGLADEQEYDDE